MRAKLTKSDVDGLKAAQKPYEARFGELTGLLLRVQPSGVKTWYFDYRHEGARNRTRLGTFPGLSCDGARRAGLEAAAKAAQGVDLQGEKKEAKAARARARSRTLRSFLTNHYEDWARQHLKSGAFQLARLKADFEDWFDKPMEELNDWLVQGWRTRQLKGGKSRKTVNRDLQRLQSCLSKAVSLKVLAVHPFAGLKRLKVDEQERVRYLAPDEEERVRGALVARESNLRKARDRFNVWRRKRKLKPLPERTGAFIDHLRPLTIVALNTGMRRNELLTLQWKDVDFHGRLVTVTSTTAKSGRARRIPLNAEALEMLKEWQKHTGTTSPEGYVFLGPGAEPMKRIDTAWASLRKLAKLSDFRFHDCRHHFASRLVQGGTDLNVVRELLGHSDIKTTLRYAHLAPGNLRSAVDGLV